MSESPSESLLRSAAEHRAAGRWQQAADTYQSVLAADPLNYRANYELGLLARSVGQLDHAEQFLVRAVEIRPGDADAQSELALLHLQQGKIDLAFDLWEKVIRASPDHAATYFYVGSSLLGAGQPDDALPYAMRAAQLRPDQARAFNLLGEVFNYLGRSDDAMKCQREALRLEPSNARTYQQLGRALIRRGDIEDAVSAYRQGHALDPSDYALHSGLLLALHYLPDFPSEELFDEHLNWAKQHAASCHPERSEGPQGEHAIDSEIPRSARDDRSAASRKLRIGYVSGDFRAHPVGIFMMPILTHHDRTKFDIVCYNTNPHADATTPKFKSLASVWRDVATLNDDQLAAQIRDDRIDLLIDLAGHTANNRLLVFARKPAPVQATYLGYPNTTGLSTIDFRLTDIHADPPGQTESLYTETLMRLPETAWCYEPPADAPDVAPLPTLAAGHVTFGSFSNFAKINSRCLDLWAKVLAAVPRSRLLLKAATFRDAQSRERLAGEFAKRGIESNRLELVGYINGARDHLDLYSKIDIALDTFPYHGTTTTCEALWMGVPVVTLAGRTHVSRVGVSLLSNVGLSDFIAQGESDYIAIASRVAGDLSALAELRRGLRETMRKSSLTGASRFTRQLESAFVEMIATRHSDS